MRRRLATLLALSQAETDLLVARCEARLGVAACTLRLVVLLIVTAPLVRRLVPMRARRRAIRPFVYTLISGVSENLLYAGIAPGGPTTDA